MAVNTKARRASVQAYTLGLMRPPPGGTVDASDRATVTWLYSGLSYSTDHGSLPLFGLAYFKSMLGWFWMR